jgi:hypothetical protein
MKGQVVYGTIQEHMRALRLSKATLMCLSALNGLRESIDGEKKASGIQGQR